MSNKPTGVIGIPQGAWLPVESVGHGKYGVQCVRCGFIPRKPMSRYALNLAAKSGKTRCCFCQPRLKERRKVAKGKYIDSLLVSLYDENRTSILEYGISEPSYIFQICAPYSTSTMEHDAPMFPVEFLGDYFSDSEQVSI